ncbi:MAG TPA: PLDc N-terminal domain-containing protein [Streptosporangiaceae bacterium]|nr:PLDc N-terminal domain-containing protein [Streptosporangiaceae bacterium]
MSDTQPVRRIAEMFIRASCRRLPEDERGERCREWSAELPAILDDTSVRLPLQRAVRALRYSAGISRTTRQLRRASGRPAKAGSAGWRDGAMPVRPAGPGSRMTIGAIVWLIVIFAAVVLLRAHPHPDSWPFIGFLALAAAFDGFCLIDIVRAGEVRYLPKWAWALICLAQCPGGGIVYLCVGRVNRAKSAPPGSAQRP